MKTNSLLVEVINEIKDKRPHIKEILCEAIILEIEDKMEKAYEEGIKEGRKQTLNSLIEKNQRKHGDY